MAFIVGEGNTLHTIQSRSGSNKHFTGSLSCTCARAQPGEIVVWVADRDGWVCGDCVTRCRACDFVVGELHECESCEKTLCEFCMHKCAVCCEMSCNDHVTELDYNGVGGMVCSDCTVECEVCSTKILEENMRDNRCGICDLVACSSCATGCDSCDNRACFECSTHFIMCGWGGCIDMLCGDCGEECNECGTPLCENHNAYFCDACSPRTSRPDTESNK